MRPSLRVLTTALSILMFTTVARAQWAVDGAPVTLANDWQNTFIAVPDGSGGTIVAWRDLRVGSNWDIYAQRLNAAGVPQWTADGVPIATTVDFQSNPSIVADGSGGAIIVWDEFHMATNTDVYAQRINASGATLWTAGGVVVCNAANAQEYASVVSDGASGAIVSWTDSRTGTADVYAQRLSPMGGALWTANGKSVCSAINIQGGALMLADGSSGAYVVWADYRSGTGDIYIQRVNSAGNPLWTVDGVAVVTATSSQSNHRLATDGAGGIFIVWQDARSGSQNDIFAQRFNASGTALWPANGVMVCGANADQYSPTIVYDGAGGAIITWMDYRDSVSYNIYARRMSASGSAQWQTDGVPITTAASHQIYPLVVSDGAGGALIAWEDQRNTLEDVFAARVNSAGALMWAGDKPVCTAVGAQHLAQLVSDGTGGAIAVWQDERSGIDGYAQHIDGRYGAWGKPEPAVTLVADIRNDQGGKVKVNWTASGRDVLNQQLISHYSVWRGSDVAPASSALNASSVVTDPSRVGRDFAGTALWKHGEPQKADYYWEWVGNQNALYQKAYTYSAATRADSTAQGVANAHFMVVAHTADPYTFWPSNELAGHSVDNLAPAAPLALTAQRVGNYVYLKWNRVRVPDLRDYAVYRKTSAGVTPVPINFLSTSPDTLQTDSSAPASAIYYIVTAYDVHSNQSVPSNEVALAPATGVGNLPPITSLMVLQNHPNPFGSSSTLQVGLPVESRIHLEIFDIAGRRVANRQFGVKAAGWQSLPLDARDDKGRTLANGVYFYRLHAAGQTQTRKMVIAR